MSAKPVIMVVDDEIANIELIAAVLEEDYEIVFARSGEQAIDVARKFVPDLILLDVVMPGLDGYETCRRIKQDPGLADVPVIFTTGRDAVEDEVRGLAAGAIDYVTKPVQPVALRRRVSNHIGLKQKRDRLASLALIDPLTGLGNRRMFEDLLKDEVARLTPLGGWLSVILVDIDFFKQFNDMYGHPAGDRCLAQVAGRLSAAMRRGGDRCTRYGGEEFVCILPGADSMGAMQVARQMLHEVEALAIPHAGSRVAEVVTISSGVVSRRCESGLPVSFWVETADKLLYESKRLGRNRITARTIGAA